MISGIVHFFLYVNVMHKLKNFCYVATGRKLQIHFENKILLLS